MRSTGILALVIGSPMLIYGFVKGYIIGFYPSEEFMTNVCLVGGALVVTLGLTLLRKSQPLPTVPPEGSGSGSRDESGFDSR